MNLHTIVTCTVLAFVSCKIVSPEGVGNEIYIRMARCNFSQKFLYNLTCFAKSYSRNFSGVNIHATTRMPVYDVNIIVKLFFKYGMIYREVLTTPKIDICNLSKLMKTDKKLINRWSLAVAEIVEDTVPGQIHECPYHNFDVNNKSLNVVSVPSLFPTGDYKMIFICYSGEEFVATVNAIVFVESSNKDTFG